jgi:hypothetical protein
MANQRNVMAVLVVGALTLIVGGAGLYLGFASGRSPQHGPPVPKQPDTGPILFDMRSLRSDPDRIRFEWARFDDATAYRVTVLSASDDSLFASPALQSNAWVIPAGLRQKLASQAVYHWRVTVFAKNGGVRSSDPAAFATQ